MLPRRPLGNTGLDVSVLGYGASPLGGVFHVRIWAYRMSYVLNQLMIIFQCLPVVDRCVVPIRQKGVACRGWPFNSAPLVQCRCPF